MPDHRQGNIIVHSIQKTATQHKALTSVMAVSTQRRGTDPAALTLQRHHTTRPGIEVASQLRYSPAVRAGRRHSRVIRGAVYGCPRSRRSRPLPPQHRPLPPQHRPLPPQHHPLRPQPQQSSGPSPPAACPCAHAPRRARDWQTHMQMTVRLSCPARMFHSLVQHSPLAVFPQRHAHPAALPASRMDGMPCRLPGGTAQAHLASLAHVVQIPHFPPHAWTYRRHGTGALCERLAHVVVLPPQQLEAAPLVRR